MARNLFGVEIGHAVYAENGDLLFGIIGGTAVPDGTSGKQSVLPIGSLYVRSGTGELYQKIANAGAPADYELNGSAAAVIGKWREENVVALTDDTVSAGTIDYAVSPFSDDDGPLVPADFVVGKYVIGDANGTPALFEITAQTGDDVTFAAAGDAMVADDTFVVDHYLPDSAGQENKAIVNHNGSVVVKVSDIDWEFADAINLTGGYTPGSGNPTSADSVESAIEKLDGNNDNQDTLLGAAQGATDLGTFTGATIPDSSTVKSALQAVETAYEETDQNVDDLITLSGVAENSTNLGVWTAPVTLLFSATSTVKALFQRIGVLLMQLRGVQVTGITTSTAVDAVPHASVRTCKWYAEVFSEATPANRMGYEVFAMTDGTNVDDNVVKLKMGSSIAGLDLTVAINGANMELQITATGAVTATVRRIEVVKSVL